MSHVCRSCHGRGYRWTGAERVACGRCGGNGGLELPVESRRVDGPAVADPVRSRTR